jgi:hypothetical protein
LRIVRNWRQSLAGEFLGVDEVAVFEPMADGYDQLSAVYQQTVAGDDVVVAQREAADGGVDPAVGNRLELVCKRQFHPFEGYAVKLLVDFGHQRERQLVEAAAQEPYPQDGGLAASLMLALLKCLPQSRGRRFGAQPEANSERSQRNSAAGAIEERSTHFALQCAYWLRDWRLREKHVLGGAAEVKLMCHLEEAVDLP